MGAAQGICPWDRALVMRKSDGRAFWVGCGWFFFWAGRGGKRKSQGTSTGSVFAGRHALLNSPIFLCYILYIEQWKFRCYMLQTIANGAPESSRPWADTRVVRVSTPRRPLPRTENSEGAAAPRSTTDSTDQWVWCLMHMWSMLYVISVIYLV
jgi:hypothetical protein